MAVSQLVVAGAGAAALALILRARRRSALPQKQTAEAQSVAHKKPKTLQAVGKAVMQASALHVAARKKDARAIFDEMDENHDGIISRDEAAKWLHANPEWTAALGISPVVDAFLAAVDDDGSGHVSRAEFSAWWHRLASSSSTLLVCDSNLNTGQGRAATRPTRLCARQWHRERPLR